MSTDPALNDYVSGSEAGGGIGNTFNFHLYNYGNNNPVKYKDPDGNSAIAAGIIWGGNVCLFTYGLGASRDDEIGFSLRHPIIATQLGSPKDGGKHGINSAATNFAINSGLPKSSYNGFDTKVDEGSKKGAYRHAVWQAIICANYGENIATEVGNSHDPKTPKFKESYTSLSDADTYCDQLNNIVGRSIGKNSNLSNKELALKTLNKFHEDGLYTVKQNEDNTYSIVLTKITDAEYKKAFAEILIRNNQGLKE